MEQTKKSKKNTATAIRKAKEKAYEAEFGREFPKGKKIPRAKRFESQPVRKDAEVEMYEEKPESAGIFIERMLVLGFSFGTITDQCLLRYEMQEATVRKMVDRIREGWVLFTALPEKQKRAEMEMQLNNIMRMALEESDYTAATVCMKRKMELNGMQVQKTSNNAQGVTVKQLLGEEIFEKRAQALAKVGK